MFRCCILIVFFLQMINNMTDAAQGPAVIGGVRIMVLTGMAVFLLFLIASNIFFIVCIARCSRLQTAGNFLLVNLAVADLAVGVYGLPTLALVAVLGSTETYTQLLQSRTICLVGYFFYICPLSVSQMFLLLGSGERYFAIQNPFRHEVIFTKKAVAGMSAGTWLYNVLYHCLPLLGWNEWEDDGSCSHPDFPLPYLLISDLHYCFFLLGIITLYTKMLLTAHNQAQKIVAGSLRSTENTTSSPGSHVGFRTFKAARTTTAIVGFFVLLTMPHVVTSHIKVWVWQSGHPPSQIIDKVGNVLWYLAYINSGINPIIYSVTNRPLRQAMKGLLCSCRKSRTATAVSPIP